MTRPAADTSRFAIDVRLSLAVVPSFAPAGWEAASYERHLDAGMPEVRAWHRQHWPSVRRFGDFADHLDLHAWEVDAWAALIADANAVGLPADQSWMPAPRGDRFPFARMRAELDARCGDDFLKQRADSGAVVRERHTCGIGTSTTWNQAEPVDTQLDAAGIVALLARLVSIGQDLVLAIGPRPDGSIPDHYASALGAVGRWLRRHGAAFEHTGRFDVGGDDSVRYTACPGPDDTTRTVYITDLNGAFSLDLPHFSPHRYPIEAVEGAATWTQDPAGLHVVAPPRPALTHGDPAALTYRLTIRNKRARSLLVTGERAGGAVRIGDTAYVTVGAALAAAEPGDFVDLPPGRYGSPAERLPLIVPAGVTLIGQAVGAAGIDPPTIDGSDLDRGTPAVVLGSGSALAHLTVLGGAPGSPTSVAVASDGATSTKIERSTLHGGVDHHGGSDHVVEFTTVVDGTLSVAGADRATVTGNRVTGVTRDGRVTDQLGPPEGAPGGCGVEISGGREHRVDANTIDTVQRAIILRHTTRANVSANAAIAGQEAITISNCRDTDVTGNQCRGGRAITVEGSANTQVTANIADHTDTGLVLDLLATDTVATGNQFVGCRLGVLAWSHRGSSLHGNRHTDCREPDVVT